MKHQRLASAIGAVIEGLEDRQLLSAVVGPAAQTAILNGNYTGTLHVGHLNAGFFGATAAANPHTIPATLDVTEGANGLITGTLSLGAAAGTSAQTFNVQGVDVGRKFDAVFWQGSSLATATASGELKGNLTGGGTLVHGSVIERIGGHVAHANFKLSPSVTTAQLVSAATLFGPSTTSSVSNYVGTAHLHVPHALVGTTLSGGVKLASGKEGLSLNVTEQSANGSLAGTITLQGLGTFNFVGTRNGSKETLVFNGANGSGTATAHVGSANVAISGSFSDMLNGQILTGSFHARNVVSTTASNASGSGSNSNSGGGTNASTGSPITGTTAGMGLGGTPTATTGGTSVGTTNATSSAQLNNSGTATNNGATSGVGLGLGGTPTPIAGSPGSAGGAPGTPGSPTLVGSPGSAGGAIGTPGSPTIAGSPGSAGGAIGTPGSATLVGSPGSAGGAIGTPGSPTLVGSPGSAGSAIGTPGSVSDLVGSVNTTGGTSAGATGSVGSIGGTSGNISPGFDVTSGVSGSDMSLSGSSSAFAGI